MAITLDGTTGAIGASSLTATGAISAGSVDATTVTEGAVEMPKMVLSTAQATTSGTSIDFTGIPSWVKRITVMFNGVSTNGNTHLLVQLGSGSVTTSGYRSITAAIPGGAYGAAALITTGFAIWNADAAEVSDCIMTIALSSGNSFVSSHSGGKASGATPYVLSGGGYISLAGTLDRIRLTTVNGTDTFDAGSINILLEG